MNIADACCQEIYAQISDSLALLRIGALAHSYHAVFLAADGTHFRLNGNTLAVCGGNQLCGFCHVFVNGIMGTVKHNG